ncbi:MAG: hypothetical protein IKI28_09140 [Bacteroidales bacterium]|nr:hypothetical protein [Bacteroidales bacterium]
MQQKAEKLHKQPSYSTLLRPATFTLIPRASKNAVSPTVRPIMLQIEQ